MENKMTHIEREMFERLRSYLKGHGFGALANEALTNLDNIENEYKERLIQISEVSDEQSRLIQSQLDLENENAKLKRGYEIDKEFNEVIKDIEDSCTYCGRPEPAIKSVAWQHVIIGGLYEADEDENAWMKTTTYIDGRVNHDFSSTGPNGENL